jgi:hypothetical protein
MTAPSVLRRPAALLGLVLVAVLALSSACAGDDSGDAGGSSDDSGSVSADEATSDTVAADVDALAGGESAAGGRSADTQSGPVIDPAVAEDREIISTAEIHLRVDDLDEGRQRLNRLVGRAGGYVFGENTDLRQGARTRIVIKVPPRRFRALLDDLGSLGDVETQTIHTDDVTDQVVDLDSRISTAEASVFRLRALLDDATVIPDIANIENQLLQRETELERLRGQRRTIDNQVSLATITAVLRADRTAPPPPPEDPQPGFFDGLHGGVDAFRTFAIGVSAVVGALLPWTPLLLLIGLVAWRVARRKPSSRTI